MRHLFLWLCILCSTKAFAQLTDNATLTKRIREHVYVLAADSLEGRTTGSEGERKAIRYITKHYDAIGLTAKGVNGYKQEFVFNNGMRYNGDNVLLIDGLLLKPDVDFFPLPGSGSAVLTKEKTEWVNYGIEAGDSKQADYKNIKPAVFIIAIGGNDSMNNPHSALYQYTDINYKIKTAIDHGAKAILFVNTDTTINEELTKDFTRNSSTKSIPILFIRSKASSRFNFTNGKPHVVSLTVNVEPVKRTGTNIVAMIDNPGTDRIVVIGAHFDHLGMGHDGNSLHPSAGGHIHNGADDNASGTAAVVELARMLKTSNLRNNDYVFINFSGEELGLIGSKYFVEHATIDTSKINYMINMDMIGRYQADKGIEVSGIGTSPQSFMFLNAYNFEGLKIKPGQSGTGPTDHTSFYYANIPVLNFFTGTHEDYHKPSDDADKVNYTEAATIVRMIYTIVDSLDNDGKLPFSKTAEQSMSGAASFKVRMGIIPDYMFEGPGVRIDGTSENMPAIKAGLQKGDIVLEMDGFPIADVMSYMQALSHHKKGDAVVVKYKRGTEQLTTTVQF